MWRAGLVALVMAAGCSALDGLSDVDEYDAFETLPITQSVASLPTEQALDAGQLDDPEEMERAALALLEAFPDHPVSVDACLVLARLAADPSASTYHPEESLAWALEALELDPSVVPEVARLLEVLPGDLPLPDWAYDLLLLQWHIDEITDPSDQSFEGGTP
jgi:hypothetical protein